LFCTISGIGRTLFFSNIYNLGMKRDTAKEYETNLVFALSIDLIECFLRSNLVPFSSIRGLKHMRAALLSLIVGTCLVDEEKTGHYV